jgi:chemosensory pili system protein ChpA (sensor histidine kinase/response regulator)
MSQDKELEIRRLFLDEAQEYLNTLDEAVLDLSSNRIEIQKINAALRAAHSIKGGAGMMGFELLADLAHRLEDAFKVLKNPPPAIAIDGHLENLLLVAINSLRQIIYCDRQGQPPDPSWLQDQVEPVFQHLHQHLGDPLDENVASVLAVDSGQDILSLLFETEVEGCLERLETLLAQADRAGLQEELANLVQELGGLGEMLELPAFCQLCESVQQHLETMPAPITTIAQEALQAWRRSQVLVLTGQLESLPTALSDLPTVTDTVPIPAQPAVATWEEEAAFTPAIAADSEVEHDDLLIHSTPEPEVFPDFLKTIPVHSASNRSDSSPEQALAARSLEFKSAIAAAEEDENATVRVSVRQLNQLNDLFGQLTIERNGLDLYLKRLRNLARTLAHRVRSLEQSNLDVRMAYDRVTAHEEDLELSLANLRLQSSKFNPKSKIQNPKFDNLKFDILELDQYNHLHLLSQQVMETIVQVQEVTGDIQLSLDDTEQTVRDLNKTAKQLQLNLTQIRMRPLSDVVDRFPRSLRELCLQYGKQAKLVVHGGNILIDRNILEALNDPLMHLFRNAFDHGIEPPEVREAAGKPATGTIEIAATHRGNRTVITIRDDGQGIPLHKIRIRAEEMGLDPVLLANASDEDLLSLIFEPGFSTSSEVTALSGRGVGMDVVRDSLRQIHGEISVNTCAGVGTTFTLSVPFTLSVVQALLVESNGLPLAIPTDAIAEMFLLQPDQVMMTVSGEMLKWNDTLVQLIRLSHWLQFNCPHQHHTSETAPAIDAPTVLIVQRNQQWVGLLIDRSWGEQEVAIRKVEGNIPLPPGFANCVIVGDGRVIPLVNTVELLDWIASYPPITSWAIPPASEEAVAALPPTSPARGTETPRSRQSSSKATILIVDDSINIRRFLALTLERAGFRVEQAKDGQDALEKLQKGLSVQAVICDIEMPRLDGYGFLAKVKADPVLEQLPVAMLTSRSGDKHRQLALSLGATAYFSKPYNEQVLLRTLEALVMN